MQLKKVSIEKNRFKNGLDAIDIHNLGQIVALFGPNGAGKTRLLNSVVRIIEGNSLFLNKHDKKIRGVNEEIKRFDKYEKDLKLDYESIDPRDKPEFLKTIKEIEVTQKQLKSKLQNMQRSRELSLAAYSAAPSESIFLVQLGLGNKSFREIKTTSRRSRLETSVGQIRKWGSPNSVINATYWLLRHLAMSAFHRDHPKIKENNITKKAALFDEARRILKIMMNMELDYKVVGSAPFKALPTLNGRKLDLGELSNGQVVILAYLGYLISELISRQESQQHTTLEGAIIIIDEPELHLHPEALIQIIRSMREVVGEGGQIWLATHCLCLLPHLRTNEIWTIYAGKISSPGMESYHDAVQLLVGAGENFDKLQNFLQEPYKWAAVRFAAECLVAPTRIGFRKGDPQLFQISEIIAKKLNGRGRISLVDYGAGKGRLATMLRLSLNDVQRRRMKYIPVEPDASCHEEIIQAAGDILEKCGVQKNGARLTDYKGKVDVVVLCNVLHEIRPKEWNNELKKAIQLLKPKGSLIICEDEAIPTGELPHTSGFIILGLKELQTLFSLDEEPRCKRHQVDRYKERLLCVEIPKEKAKVSPASVKAAIEHLQSRLRSLIIRARKEKTKPTARKGRRYALYSQMLVNCQFALEELK